MLRHDMHTAIVKFLDALASRVLKLRMWSKKAFDGNYYTFIILDMENQNTSGILQENLYLIWQLSKNSSTIFSESV